MTDMLKLEHGERGVVYVCLGETDEWHPFCPFATRSKAKADEHEKIPGHWVEIDQDGLSDRGLWAQVLKAEDEENSRAA